MKNIYRIFMLLSLVVISACRESDNATMLDGIVYLNQPHITKDADGDLAILDTDPMAFKGSVNVELFFKDTKNPDYLDLVVVKNGDVKNAKLLKGNISTYPTSVPVSGQLFKDLFGAEPIAGDNFDIGANYIEGGKTYLAFPEEGESYGAGVWAQGGASPTVRFSVICGFIADENIGDYEVKLDGWNDYGVGSIVEVKKVNETELSIDYAFPTFEPLLLKINPKDNTIKIESKEIASESVLADVYGGGGAYGSLTVSTAGAVTSSVIDPCVGEIVLNIQYVLSKYGNQGAFVLKLKKKN